MPMLAFKFEMRFGIQVGCEPAIKNVACAEMPAAVFVYVIVFQFAAGL
jgi:hypothetical protein